MKTYYMVEMIHGFNESYKLYRTEEEAKRCLYDLGYEVTSNPWLGTSYSKRNGEVYLEARIVKVEIPDYPVNPDER